jgi:nucleoside-diphosphate-sugar epimerase
MRIFLTGATGYLGAAALDALLRAGHQVTALVRQPGRAHDLEARGVTPVLGDLAAPAAWLPAVDAAEAVVHTGLDSTARGVAVDRQFIDTVMPVLWRQGGGRALIYTSGVWVLGESPQPADESAPLAPAEISAWRVAHERQVLEGGGGGVRTVVVRPGIVYGGGRGIVGDLLKGAMNGLIRVIGDGANHWPAIYDRDLADLYARLVASPEASGLFHATDEADERVVDVVEAMAAHLPSRPSVRHVPLAEARTKMGPLADALALDQIVRSPRARALGWTPSLRSIGGNVARLFEEYRAAHR